MQTDCDVLIIGSGMAGIRAAIEASDCGADIMMVTKKKQGFGGASFYPNSLPWGILTAGQEEDAAKNYYDEVIAASCGAINKKLAAILASQSNARFKDLVNYGIKFTTLAEKNRVPCFGKQSRGAQLNNMSNLRECLNEQIKKRPIKAVENVSIMELLVKDGQCFGAVGADKNGQIISFKAKAVILATGGAESLWKYNLVTPDVSGDGYAMALRNGARLVNMEFIQFIPGSVNTGASLNFHSSSLKSLPKILNSKGEEVLQKYLPADVSIEQCLMSRALHGPFSNEDESRYFDIALALEYKAGNGKGAEIVYGTSYYEENKFELWKALLASKGIDTKKLNIKIYPHCQGFNGGIVIDENCRTDIENLYACGECSGGPHGANRMGGNAILDTQVFGKIAGENAAKHSATAITFPDIDVASIVKSVYDSGNNSKLEAEEVLSSVKEIMTDSALIVREQSKLSKARLKIREIERVFNAYQAGKGSEDILKSVNAKNSILTAKAILHAMLKRRESRGSHYRADYPDKTYVENQMNEIAIEDLSEEE